VLVKEVNELMLNGKRITVVLPACNARRALRKTCEEIPPEIVNEISLVDDPRVDGTMELARGLLLNILKLRKISVS